MGTETGYSAASRDKFARLKSLKPRMGTETY